MSKRIECPIAKSNNIDQCKTCEYKDGCLEDILSNFEGKAMRLAGKTIKKIRRVIEKNEKGTRGVE